MSSMFPKEELLATMRCRSGALLPCKLDWPIEKICYWGGHPVDTRPAGAPIWRDLWGVGWQKTSADPAMLPFPIEHPLETLDLARLSVPDAGDRKLFADLVNLRHSPHCLLVGMHPFALLERAWLLTGIQNLSESMTRSAEQVHELMSRVADFEVGVARGYLALGVEAGWIADDYGITTNVIFSAPMWRQYIRPQLARLVQAYHEAGALVVLHSRGNLTDLVPDLLELGVDVLDPLQPNCNRLDEIRRQTAGRMCLCGGIEASTLMAGDRSKTVADTRRRVDLLGGEGGYIPGPDEDWDFPESTHGAMLEVVEDYREEARRERGRQRQQRGPGKAPRDTRGH